MSWVPSEATAYLGMGAIVRSARGLRALCSTHVPDTPCLLMLGLTPAGTVPRSSPATIVLFRCDSRQRTAYNSSAGYVDVDPLCGLPALGYPEQSVQRHDVVDAKA